MSEVRAAFTLKALPNPGYEIVSLRGQRYELVKLVPYRTSAGVASRVLTWRGRCIDCDGEFDQTSGLTVRSKQLVRRCKACRAANSGIDGAFSEEDKAAIRRRRFGETAAGWRNERKLVEAGLASVSAVAITSAFLSKSKNSIQCLVKFNDGKVREVLFRDRDNYAVRGADKASLAPQLDALEAILDGELRRIIFGS